MFNLCYLCDRMEILIPSSLYHWTYVGFRLCVASTNSNQLSGIVNLHSLLLYYTTCTITIVLYYYHYCLSSQTGNNPPIMNIPSDSTFMLYFENTSVSTMLGPVMFHEGSGV